MVTGNPIRWTLAELEKEVRESIFLGIWLKRLVRNLPELLNFTFKKVNGANGHQ